MSSRTEQLGRSDALHARVQAFARGHGHDTFEDLAWDIARFQRAHVASTRPLWELPAFANDGTPGLPLWRIPALPVEAMRYVSVFAFELGAAVHTFETSGTTSGETGRHHGRVRATYETLLLEGAKAFLVPKTARAVVVALMPPQPEPIRSSLGYMARQLMREFDGRALTVGRDVAGFSSAQTERWLLSAAGVDVNGLRRVIDVARAAAEPLLLLTTSFALLTLFDQLGDERLPLPDGSVVMPTGGFKGRTREVSESWLRERTQQLLAPYAIVHEYGMTELSSQLYEATHPGLERAAAPELYYETRTVRVIPVDPITHTPVADGQIGLASFVDLGNVDSALRILTQDLVVREGDGIRLLGRHERAPVRGCSLSAESLTSGVRAQVTPVRTALVPVELPRRNDTERNLALDRVRRLVTAARELRDPDTVAGQLLRAELGAAGVLSPRGVEVALTHCLEVDVGNDELERLVDSTVPAPRVWVVSSANVFVAAHRALALALASSADVCVKPSRREPALTKALAALVPDSFRLVRELEPRPGDHVHAYGSDRTLATIRANLPEGVQFMGHGDGIGVVWIGRARAFSEVATNLALDIALFDQRGCASPRVVALAEEVPVDGFVHSLEMAMEELARWMPIGRLTPDERGSLSHYRALTAVVTRRSVWGSGGSIAVQDPSDRVLLPPIGRNVVVVAGARALEQLAEAASLVTTVGIEGDEATWAQIAKLFPSARRCETGRMQRPTFDGPLDLRERPIGRAP